MSGGFEGCGSLFWNFGKFCKNCLDGNSKLYNLVKDYEIGEINRIIV